MAKEKQVFFCKECGYESAKWQGQCPGCRAWNTFSEEKIKVGATKSSSLRREAVAPTSIKEVTATSENRIITGIEEFDRVLGGGIVEGSLVLIGGDPGIGKSTLLLQMCRELSEKEVAVLYVSGEESLSQIKMRAERIGEFSKEMLLLCDNNIDNIEEQLRKLKPRVAVIDSIQTMFDEAVGNAAGSVSQVREVTMRLMQLAKSENIAIFIVGHVTKEGTVAGPRTLEHMVDSVIYFEGEAMGGFRVLRGVKNRFGSTNEIGVFTMNQEGLSEVKDPSSILLETGEQAVEGSAVVSSVEGTRPILLEIQALVCRTNFNNPRRTAVGIDNNRLNLIIAVLEKRLGVRLWEFDVYVNVAGGMKLADPAVDLGIAMAILSSMEGKNLSGRSLYIGEIGLTGEIRSCSDVAKRVKEADKLGFTTAYIPAKSYDKKQLGDLSIKVIPVGNLRDMHI